MSIGILDGRKTAKGIIITRRLSGKQKECFYRDGNYPDIPAKPKKIINLRYMTTAGSLWLHDLVDYKPNRVMP